MTSRDLDGIDAVDRALTDGMEALGDDELVAMVLAARGREPVARRLLEHVGGLRGLERAGPVRLAEVHGVGRVRAFRMAAAVELGRRLQRAASKRVATVRSSAEVAALLAPRLAGLDHEQMWLLSLDGRGGVRGLRRAAQGGRHGLVVAARELLSLALADAASAFILVHNHPSGSPEPSPEDVAMTLAVRQAADIVGIPLLDHVIVAGEEFSSMLDEGLLPGDLPQEAGSEPLQPPQRWAV